MDAETLRYDQWIADALLSVVTRALTVANTEGLPGEHHFYITFRTDADGVEIPPHLRAQYPEEMTIVLQHQFWNLLVSDDSFEVTLKFQGRKNHLVVPLSALTAFADPSVNFGLQLKMMDASPAEDSAAPLDEKAEPLAAEEHAVKVQVPSKTKSPRKSKPKKGEVITLDAFRKK